jgi:putative ABC transport system permease protein
VLPVEALREAVPASGNPTRKRVIGGAVVTVIGLTGLFMTLYADLNMKLFGPSLLAIIVGVLMLLPAAARPLASLIGVPLRMRGLPGELARQNAMRNPRRTSSTAAALMVGLTLVVSMGVFASSLKASFGDIIGDSTNAACSSLRRVPRARASARRRSRRSGRVRCRQGPPPAAGGRPGSTVADSS